ncbi:M16 family metallopeptidase [Rufibacter psychrotolerans]|uniref:M16 family metallopeptidase n=1 Tax=Rufibacter psychrotolerans TaxID=2812556 RepID=UPI001967A7BC|nr:pitrilysin family protein [Rufibacter sp. SYSU D00308]
MSLNRSQAPAVAELTTDLSITPEVVSTPSGARLHIFQNNIQPVTRIEFVFQAGKWYQPKAGVASLTAKMLKEGTQSYTAKQIADMVDYYGASLEVNHGFDRATVTLYCLSKFVPTLLPLAFEVIYHPSFPEAELSLMKQRVIQTLSVDKQKNSYLATEAFTTAIYGQQHPYATLITAEEIEAITVDDLVNFHKEAYTFSTAEVFVTGDVTPADIERLRTGIKAESSSNKVGLSVPASEPKTGVQVERTANEMQASIRVGKPSLRPSHHDYPALYLLNHIFGGYFGARLMKNIREDKGFTYGIYSSLTHKEQNSLFTIGTDIKGDKVNETLEEISKEMATLRNEPIPAEELETAKKHLSGKFLSDHATIFDKMDRYRSNTLLGLPTTFYTDLLQQIQLLSAEQLQEVANKYFVDADLIKIVTGGVNKQE